GGDLLHDGQLQLLPAGADAAPGGPQVGLRPAAAGAGRRPDGSPLAPERVADRPHLSTARGHRRKLLRPFLRGGNLSPRDPSRGPRGCPSGNDRLTYRRRTPGLRLRCFPVFRLPPTAFRRRKSLPCRFTPFAALGAPPPDGSGQALL